ncbi:hypothetical protein Acid345_0965 [Candidatus Koribacter versatilis Ellin345]|uniref:Methyltransferase type 11 domain-containing protein n=1 Tax=Koribacter versatilis (strain Ellin345) TaxID=204669 RepID=Q1IT32_KORVE|nr:class I SAM-dependent methyltransferase [Candidatus Koribacter versatilis]ABF39968.1 hypothetical protein Acid345_0965 [Candidatus Koribacter versatilis Ellin345]
MGKQTESVWIPEVRPTDTAVVHESAMFRVLSAMLERGTIGRDHSLLVVFGGEFDRAVIAELAFTNVSLSNISNAVGDLHFDARAFPFPDNSFDHVIAHAGLHHCSRPHQAVCEMYRVSKKSVIFFESQDSWMMRLAIRMGMTVDYEWNAILDHRLQRGGVDDLPVPNYVYRWTRREVEKLVRSLDPGHVPHLNFTVQWDFTYKRVMRRLQRTPLRFFPSWLLSGSCRAVLATFNLLFSSYGNVFAVRIERSQTEQPWMKDGVFVPPFQVQSSEAGSCEHEVS